MSAYSQKLRQQFNWSERRNEETVKRVEGDRKNIFQKHALSLRKWLFVNFCQPTARSPHLRTCTRGDKQADIMHFTLLLNFKLSGNTRVCVESKDGCQEARRLQSRHILDRRMSEVWCGGNDNYCNLQSPQSPSRHHRVSYLRRVGWIQNVNGHYSRSSLAGRGSRALSVSRFGVTDADAPDLWYPPPLPW